VKKNKMLNAGVPITQIIKLLVKQLLDAVGRILVGAVLQVDLMLEEYLGVEVLEAQWVLNVTNMTEIKQHVQIVLSLE